MTKTVNANAAKAADQQEQMLALARAEYIKNAEAYGMKPEWLDQRFFTDESQWGTDYRVRGIKANVGKYNVVVEKLKNEKIYTMPAKNVIERFAVMAKNVAAEKAREAAAAKAKEAATATETAAAGK